MVDKLGHTFTFGSSTASRQDNPSNSSQIYKWMLSEIRDLNGNNVTYSYYKDSAKVYPTTINYTNSTSSTGIFEIEFLSRHARQGNLKRAWLHHGDEGAHL